MKYLLLLYVLAACSTATQNPESYTERVQSGGEYIKPAAQKVVKTKVVDCCGPLIYTEVKNEF